MHTRDTNLCNIARVRHLGDIDLRKSAPEASNTDVLPRSIHPGLVPAGVSEALIKSEALHYCIAINTQIRDQFYLVARDGIFQPVEGDIRR